MQHHFDVDLAVRYGFPEAIILNHFEYWIELNEKNEKNFFDGYYWTFNSMKAMCEIFPYLSEKKIRNALKHLQDEGLIITGNYNKSSYDRTLWYAVTEKGKSIMPKGQMDCFEKSNGLSQKGEPIPDNNPDNNPDNDTDNNHSRGRRNASVKIPSTEELQTRFNSTTLAESVHDWLVYKQERKEGYQATSLKSLLTQIENKVKKHGESAVIGVITLSMSNNWKGILWEKIEDKPNGANDIPRTYPKSRLNVTRL